MLEYETANPGQDLDDKEAQVFDPERDVARPNVVLREGQWVIEPISPSGGGGDNRYGNYGGSGDDYYGQTGYPMQERPARASTGSAHGHSGSRRGPTYPPVEGASNYPPASDATTSLNTYRAGPDADAARYSRSAGRG